MSGVDVVPQDARRELDRIRTRWAQLPLDRAEESLPAVRAVLDDLATRTAATTGATVPDLGPAVVPDQLAVLVWDACAADAGEGVGDLLAGLRRALP
ncbi:hypothetical protein [Oryzobacter terrae]|uniref:hypothetical protein n=1 Tax=Oryzobacter terrae TaxID=1620385 RepID=UPI00366D0F9C